MSQAFVWFDNMSDNTADSTAFYEKLLGWQRSEGPGGMPFLGGAAGPFAAMGDADEAIQGWVPYAQVQDVAVATEQAVELGAKVLRKQARGPAGEFSIVRDPGGAAIALWQKA